MQILTKIKLTAFVLIIGTALAQAQEGAYHYHLNLNDVQNDQLKVTLDVPDIRQDKITFNMPKIIPGTYRESNYGRFITNFKALSEKGKELPVTRINDNQWEIAKAQKLHTVTYWVEDIFDTEIDNKIFRMSATNIESGENFVISTPGFFGYFDDMKEQPFRLTVTRPSDFYGSTGLRPVSTTGDKDVYMTEDYDELVDSPIMYNVPDISKISIGSTEVIVSVYSTLGLITSAMIAEQLEPLLKAEADYLGGELPTDKYAFIMYFEDPAKASPLQGALEHNVSSFYYLPEYPAQQIIPHILDIAAHEFFHIVTPLTIHSEQIENFDYNRANLSEHLWLYEGVTEYVSDHVQVKYDLISQSAYLQKLAEKITISKTQYNDRLPFTELSRHAASTHANQYANVYEKGALIAAMLDIRLLELSDGQFNLMDLLNRLSEKYGKDKPFKDENLFSDIETVSGLEVGAFFERYVAGAEPLPLKEYFLKAGIAYNEELEKQVATLGHIQLGFDQERGHFIVADASQADDFGREIGYQSGDLLYAVNDEPLTPQNIQTFLKSFTENTNEGDLVKIELGRKNANGEYDTLKLSAPAQTKTVPGQISLTLIENPSDAQLKLRNAWLMSVPADPADVESIDALLGAFYEVISGPAGERDWQRFKSLFTKDAQLAAIGRDQSGQTVLHFMTPEGYKKQNAPFFLKNGFWENELGRKTSVYGDAATIASTYGYTLKEGTEPMQRGVNFISVARMKGRWWITHVLWNSETPDNPLPEEYLGRN